MLTWTSHSKPGGLGLGSLRHMSRYFSLGRPMAARVLSPTPDDQPSAPRKSTHGGEAAGELRGGLGFGERVADSVGVTSGVVIVGVCVGEAVAATVGVTSGVVAVGVVTVGLGVCVAGSSDSSPRLPSWLVMTAPPMIVATASTAPAVARRWRRRRRSPPR